MRGASRTERTWTTGSPSSCAISRSSGGRPERRGQPVLDPADLPFLVEDVHRHANRPSLVRHSPLNRLTDPPRRVGRELVSAPPVELLDRTDQPQDALLDQVDQREIVALVALGDRDDEAEVGVDHPFLGLLISTLDPLGELELLPRRQQRIASHLVEEELERVGGRSRKVAVGIRDLARLLPTVVVTHLDLGCVEVLVESPELLRVELAGGELDLREWKVSLLLAPRDQCLDRFRRHRGLRCRVRCGWPLRSASVSGSASSRSREA